MSEKYQELVTRELTRKDFLKFIGGGIVVLLGMSNFIQYLSQFHQTGKTALPQTNRHGFGSSKFGA